ncbi:MAG TPA: hypothetical protein PLQ54_15065, partial [Armatimonadota bacterium]|nr:hypothetical protein [Armatimonadota bacterium]
MARRRSPELVTPLHPSSYSFGGRTVVRTRAGETRTVGPLPAAPWPALPERYTVGSVVSQCQEPDRCDLWLAGAPDPREGYAGPDHVCSGVAATSRWAYAAERVPAMGSGCEPRDTIDCAMSNVATTADEFGNGWHRDACERLGAKRALCPPLLVRSEPRQHGFVAFREVASRRGLTRVYVFGLIHWEYFGDAPEDDGYDEDGNARCIWVTDMRPVWDSTATLYDGPETTEAHRAARRVCRWFDARLCGRPTSDGRPPR